MKREYVFVKHSPGGWMMPGEKWAEPSSTSRITITLEGESEIEFTTKLLEKIEQYDLKLLSHGFILQGMITNCC